MVTVRFMALTGKLCTVRTADFASMAEAKAAVIEHATAAGYTDVKTVDDDSDDMSIRFTARTPGGRHGRNVAFADVDDYQAFVDSGAHPLIAGATVTVLRRLKSDGEE